MIQSCAKIEYWDEDHFWLNETQIKSSVYVLKNGYLLTKATIQLQT